MHLAGRHHVRRQASGRTELSRISRNRTGLRRAFRNVVKKAGLDPTSWTPRELCHSFVSLLSNAGVSIEDISNLVGHASTVVTQRVYRKELRPVLTRGAETMDIVFNTETTGGLLGQQLGEQVADSDEWSRDDESGDRR